MYRQLQQRSRALAVAATIARRVPWHKAGAGVDGQQAVEAIKSLGTALDAKPQALGQHALEALAELGQALRALLNDKPCGDVDRIELLAHFVIHGCKALKREDKGGVTQLLSRFAVGLERRWLATRVRCGSEEASGALWLSLWKPLVLAVQAELSRWMAHHHDVSPDPNLADDVANEVVLVVLSKLKAGCFESEPALSPDPLLAFARQIARMKLRSSLRSTLKHHNRHVSEVSDESYTQCGESAVVSVASVPPGPVEVALALLMQNPRRVRGSTFLKQRIMNDASSGEIARSNGCSLASVEKSIERASLWVLETWLVEPNLHDALDVFGRGDRMLAVVRILLKLFRARLRACSSNVIRRLTDALELESGVQDALCALMGSWRYLEEKLGAWRRTRHSRLLCVLDDLKVSDQDRMLLNVFAGLSCGSNTRPRRRFEDPVVLDVEVWTPELLRGFAARLLSLMARIASALRTPALSRPDLRLRRRLRLFVRLGLWRNAPLLRGRGPPGRIPLRECSTEAAHPLVPPLLYLKSAV